jgi:hypothetical protein
LSQKALVFEQKGHVFIRADMPFVKVFKCASRGSGVWGRQVQEVQAVHGVSIISCIS